MLQREIHIVVTYFLLLFEKLLLPLPKERITAVRIFVTTNVYEYIITANTTEKKYKLYI